MVMIADFEAISAKATTRELRVDISSPIDMAPVMTTANLTCGRDLLVCESRIYDRCKAGAALHPRDSLILECAREGADVRAWCYQATKLGRRVLGFRALLE